MLVFFVCLEEEGQETVQIVKDFGSGLERRCTRRGSYSAKGRVSAF